MRHSITQRFSTSLVRIVHIVCLSSWEYQPSYHLVSYCAVVTQSVTSGDILKGTLSVLFKEIINRKFIEMIVLNVETPQLLNVPRALQLNQLASFILPTWLFVIWMFCLHFGKEISKLQTLFWGCWMQFVQHSYSSLTNIYKYKNLGTYSLASLSFILLFTRDCCYCMLY